jgi:LuxR family maltose regulon positive regulatory protein
VDFDVYHPTVPSPARGRGLLPTKLRPRMARERTLERERVVEALERATTLPLTVVVGRAGAGKSTAVTSWIEGTTARVAWLSLDEADDRPMRFCAYLFAALRTAVPELTIDPAELLHAPDAEGEAIEALLADELVIPLGALPPSERVVLVLDDYHRIRDPRIHAALTWLLEQRPSALHLLLISRQDPPLPLARLRARGELGELHDADLRFVLDEAQRFYAEVMGVTLDGPMLEQVEARTEGWPAGAQLAALSLRAGGELPSGDDRHVAEYLLAEVFGSRTSEQREFLLATALFERFCAPLAAAILDVPAEAAREALDELERANLFVIPLDVHGRWFRYHHLFGEFLRQHADVRGDAWVRERHARAARWLASREHRDEAFEHALASGDAGLVTELFERWAVETLAANQTGVVRRWLDRVPAELHERHAAFAFVAGWCDVIVGQLRSGALLLDRADERSAAGAAGPMTQFVIGHMGPILRIAIDQRAGRHAQAIATCHARLAALPESDQREIRLTRASYRLQEGQIRLELGELVEAERLLDLAEQDMRIEPALDIVVLAHLAQAQRRLGRADEAERSARRALAYAEQVGVLELSGAGLAKIELGWLALERGDPQQAIAEGRTGLERNRLLRDLAYIAQGTELLARAQARAGEREDAIEVIDEALIVLEGTDMSVALERMQALRREIAGTSISAPTLQKAPAVVLDAADELTERELEVLRHVATGLANRDIAKRLHVSVGTIKTHVHRILAKLDVGNRTQAVHRARQAGLLASEGR